MEAINIKSLIISVVLFTIINILIWFSNNYQFINFAKNKALLICIILAIPISLLSFYATKYGYSALNSIWSLKLIAFGISNIVFIFLTWILMKESPLTFRTLSSLFLSFVIVGIQILIPKG
jgi:hypothetical protein